MSALGVEEQRVSSIVRFTSDEADHKGLGHGFRIEIKVVVWEEDDIVIVPSASLFRSGTKWSVFVNNSGTAAVKAASIGHNNGIEAEVLDRTLSAGDQVILCPAV